MARNVTGNRTMFANPPPSLPQWNRAFALRNDSLEMWRVVQKPVNHRGKLSGVTSSTTQIGRGAFAGCMGTLSATAVLQLRE